MARVFFLGPATVVIRYAGLTILTDPNGVHAGDHVYSGHGLTSARATNRAVEVEDLSPLHFVLLSHLHGDHFDRGAERELNKATPVSPPGTRLLPEEGWLHAHARRPQDVGAARRAQGGSYLVPYRDARYLPLRQARPRSARGCALARYGQHAGVRGRGDGHRMRMSFGEYILIHDRLREIPRRFPGVDLALLHLGGTRVLGIMVTMDAEQGVEAIRIVDPRTAIPIHYNDYEVFTSPLEDFKEAVSEAGLDERVHYLSHGDTYEFEVHGAPDGIVS